MYKYAFLIFALTFAQTSFASSKVLSCNTNYQGKSQVYRIGIKSIDQARAYFEIGDVIEIDPEVAKKTDSESTVALFDDGTKVIINAGHPNRITFEATTKYSAEEIAARNLPNDWPNFLGSGKLFASESILAYVGEFYINGDLGNKLSVWCQIN